jgi:drug/metabolite transporter (DMT)-like permease
MKTKTPGIILIVIGILMIGYTSFNFVTTERVVDIGPIKIDKEKNHFFQWPPMMGAVLAIAGVAVLLSGAKHKN